MFPAQYTGEVEEEKEEEEEVEEEDDRRRVDNRIKMVVTE